MKCFVCGNIESFTKLSPKFTNTDNYLCMQCGLVFIPSGERDFGKYYKENGYYTDSPNIAARPFLASKSLLISLAEDRIKAIKSLANVDLLNLKVLDVGCGYGEILYVLKKDYGCNVLGIEPSKTSAEIGSKMFGIVIKGILLTEYAENEKFDLLICNHTLEHLEDPIEFLKQLKNLLKPSGKLYIEVPNILSPSGGFDLKTFLYFGHMQTFSSWTLFKLLDKVGLKVQSYSDKDFLKFVCQSNGSQHVEVLKISSQQVLDFLDGYKSNYTILNTFMVYLGKFIYLIKLIRHKFLDQLYG